MLILIILKVANILIHFIVEGEEAIWVGVLISLLLFFKLILWSREILPLLQLLLSNGFHVLGGFLLFEDYLLHFGFPPVIVRLFATHTFAFMLSDCLGVRFSEGTITQFLRCKIRLHYFFLESFDCGVSGDAFLYSCLLLVGVVQLSDGILSFKQSFRVG